MSRLLLRAAPCFVAAALLIALEACQTPPCNGECEAGYICDEERQACVPEGWKPTGVCATNADCSGATPRCEVDLGRCVACLANADCPGGRCDPLSFTCTRSGACQATADCAGDASKPFCSASGQCVECLTSLDCPAVGGTRRVCDRSVNRCVASGCETDDDCAVDPGGRFCEAGSGLCVACLKDEQCTSAAPRCKAATKSCVECFEDADCDTSRGEGCDKAQNACVMQGCFTDAMCSPGRCDTTTRDCVSCLDDADCVFGGVCEGGRCAVPSTCRNSAECGSGLVCFQGACVACTSDSDCAPGQLCLSNFCAEPVTCTDGTQCHAGRTCQGGNCVPATCAADLFEPNDSVLAATPVRTEGSINATLCANERDHYLFDVAPGDGVEVTVAYPATEAPPVVELLTAAGVAPAVVTASGGTVKAVLEKMPAGPARLVVRIGGSATPNGLAYSLSVTAIGGGTCANDAREPDDTVGQARPASPGVYDGTVCPGDQDWLLVDVPADERVVASLALAPGIATGSATVEIYSLGSGGAITRDAYGFTTAVQPNAAATASRAWVLVKNLTTRKFSYTLTMDVRPKPPANDLCAQRTALAANATVSGTIRAAADEGSVSCGGAGGDVFYTLSLAAPSRVRLSLSADFPAVLSLQSACGTTDLACDATPAGPRLTFDALPAGNHVVRIDAAQPVDAGTFQLETQVSPALAPPEGEGCNALPAPLVFTNGAAQVQGNVSLASNDVVAGCGGQGGDALYLVHTDAPQRLTARLTGFPGASLTLVPLAALCVNPDLSQAICAQENGGSATIDRLAVEANDWLLVVDGGSFVSGDFTLDVTLAEPIYPPANDACSTPADLTSGTPYAGTTRGATNDLETVCSVAQTSSLDTVHRLVITETSEVSLLLDAAFDAALIVTSDDCVIPAPMTCADGTRVTLTLPALAAGSYLVWVDGYAGGSGDYTLTATVSPAQPPPSNDTCGAAEAVDLAQGDVVLSGQTLRAEDDLHPAACVEAGGAAPLTLAGADLVYAVTIPAGRTLVATLAQSDFDAALYALDSCAASACTAASDRSFVAGGTESLQVDNSASSSARTVFVVVDAWQSSARGDFSLSLVTQ